MRVRDHLPSAAHIARNRNVVVTFERQSVQQDIQPGVDLMRSPTGAGAVYHKLGKHPPAHHPGRNAIR